MNMISCDQHSEGTSPPDSWYLSELIADRQQMLCSKASFASYGFQWILVATDNTWQLWNNQVSLFWIYDEDGQL